MGSARVKDMIVVQTANEKVQVKAYLTDTPGLVVHEELVFDHATGETRFSDDRWVITHSPTGLLVSNDSLPSGKAAFMAADELREVCDWQSDDPLGDDDYNVFERIKAVIRAHQEVEDDPADVSTRYVVRPNPDGKGFVVVDLESGETHGDPTPHRGLASDLARSLNLRGS